MKRASLIAAAVALLLVGAIGGMLYWALQQLESEKNRNKTAAARQNRWADKEEPTPGETVAEPKTEPAS